MEIVDASYLNDDEKILKEEAMIDIYLSIKKAKVEKKISYEETKFHEEVYSPISANSGIKVEMEKRGWTRSGKIPTPYVNVLTGEKIRSSVECDFLKHGIAVEVQFGKYAFEALDLDRFLELQKRRIAKALVMILPCHSFSKQLSTGPGYYERAVERYKLRKIKHPAVFIGVSHGNSK